MKTLAVMQNLFLTVGCSPKSWKLLILKGCSIRYSPCPYLGGASKNAWMGQEQFTVRLHTCVLMGYR